MTNIDAIGLFDSGVGGTSIWKEVVKLLPYENTIYLADSKNAPYGEKTKEEIKRRCIQNTELLLSKGCKLIIVACNTATTNAIDYLRATYDVPFIGIEPAIKPAVLHSQTQNVGVLATKGTLTSSLFAETSAKYAKNSNVIEQNGDGLVPLIEAGKIHSEELRALLRKYLLPMVEKKIDYLVLGCTHYPYLIPEIKKIVGNNIRIIDSGEAVARQTATVLKKNNLLNTSKELGKHQFYINVEKGVLLPFLEDVSSFYKVEQLEF